ncbi:hypothetical protein [Gulosibacter massiliensis]|uniref:hypothetical protein n=1 Tax=Gulosibacter massiliensis TaxID=2479839 RepID=UPI000F631EDD|nr:hypothetical protein [Gulosibacter massiliensis]
MKKIYLKPTLPGILTDLSRGTTAAIGRASTSLEIEVAGATLEGEGDIPTENITQRVSELDDVLAEANEQLEQAMNDLAAAEEELEATQLLYDAIFAEHDNALIDAEEAIGVAAGQIETMGGEIDAAAQEAAAAKQAALEAMTEAATASGLYTVATASPTVADAEGKPVGAVWEVRSGEATARRYVLTDAATWTQVKLGTEAIGDAVIGTAQVGELDVAKLSVTGASKFSTAVMQALIADKGFFEQLYSNNVVVAGENLLPDPLMKNPRAWQNDSRVSTTGGRTGGGSILIPASTSTSGVYNVFYAADMPYAVKVTPGQRYNISAWFTSAVAGVGTTIKVTLYERFFDANGTSVTSTRAVANAATFAANTWTSLSGVSREAPDNAVYMGVGFFVQAIHNSEVRFSDPAVRSMTDGNLLVDGSVKARHIVADEVAAAVGVFIDAMMTNLSVTGVAAIKQVTTDALWAKLAVVDRLQVLTSIITQDMIATGAVTADKITASQALIDKLITPDLMAGKVLTSMFQLGDNWRWTAEALIAYAPVVGNQSVTDWANRQELVRIDPSGGISITAATAAGDPTGGIDQDGNVWGTLGSFSELEVGGVPVTNLDGPRGVQSVTMLNSDTTIATNTETRILWTTIDVEPGRMYEIETQVFARDPGNITLRWRRNTGAPPTTSNSIRSEMVNASTMHRLITFKHLIVQPFTGGDDTAVETRYVGLFLAGSANQNTVVYGPYADTGEPRTMMIVRDIGPTLEIDTQTVASTSNPNPPTSNPKRTYTKTYKATGVKRYTAGNATASDSRNITAGSYYGSSMSEKLLYQMPAAFYSDLQGATIKSAKITVRCTKTYSTSSAAQISVGYTTASGLPSTWPGHTAVSAMDIKGGQSLTNSVPSSYFSGLRSARGITVTPRNPGSLSSYAYFDATTTRITVTYEK